MSTSFKNPISIDELEELLANEKFAVVAFNHYFEYSELGPFSGQYRLKEGMKVTKHKALVDSDLEGFIVESGYDEAINKANGDARKKREEKYQLHKNDSNRIRIVSEGDSWFQYPKFKLLGITITKDVKEIIDHLIDSDKYAVKSLDAGADLLRNIYHSREYLKVIEEEKPSFFLLSAGGNDFFEVFPKMLKKNSSNGIITGWLNTNFETELNILASYYRALLIELRETFPSLHVLIHGYDYIIPRKGGKWIGQPMIDIGIIDEHEREQLIKYVIDRFNQVMVEITEENTIKGFVHYINLRGTVAQHTDAWHDEIHPNSKSFGSVADKFKKKMNELLLK